MALDQLEAGERRKPLSRVLRHPVLGKARGKEEGLDLTFIIAVRASWKCCLSTMFLVFR